ncbi:MAG: hypothetical protein J6N51_10640 [Selenomonas sp.]|nr:hypothetical protein [Selenomonas sp.]MBP3731031.1 hypothetical protein [Mailhella sp.]
MIYTSRFSNPELSSGNYTVVGIVRGLPRFKLKYERAGNIIDIAPPRELFNIYDRDEFTPPYMEHLDRLGVERISAQLRKYTELGKDVVLCCYEDVRKPNEWCHRLVFASWWMKRTGQVIPELKDDSPVKGVKKKTVEEPEIKQEELNFSEEKPPAVVEEKLLVKAIYSLWHDENGWQGGDMYYQVDRATGKKARIADAVALDLLAQGKAELLKDDDSKAKIRLVLSRDPANKAFWVDRKGNEREMDIESAVEMLKNGKARVQHITLE